MPYFPMFIDIEDKECVIIGGGLVAFRKVEALLEFGANITVVAREACGEIQGLNNAISIKLKDYDTADIENAYIVIAATNDTDLNTRISREAGELKIPVNVVDVLEECTFIFPAYLKKGDVAIGITSSGKSPIISQRIKKIIDKALPPFLEELTTTLGNVRQTVKSIFPLEEQRKRVLRKIVDNGFLHQGKVASGDIETIIEEEKKLQVNGGRDE
ncbi:MAG: siroheme synthase [Anaerocolumna sp.]|jgi:siroheme synthase-like protein|nr:siroheme synthase [Anaerocolumna sp.]